MGRGSGSDAQIAANRQESGIDLAEARDLIQLALRHVLDEKHAEHFGPFCPVCGLVTATQRFVKEWTP